MDSTNKRLVELREYLGLNQSQFAKRLGVTSQLINKIESGNTKLTITRARLICVTFGVSEQWLLAGAGDMMDDDAMLSD